MLPQEIIRKKRDGAALSEAEIGVIVGTLADGRLSDAQVGAFAMAVFLRGMSVEERVALTRAMTRSGTVLTWDAEVLGGPALDKHSTGGVGDGVSLMLAPLVAACGGFVPMISGRGLGHTGGTLDKFEAIPGYTVQPSIERFREVVAAVGCAVIGQTADLAPADKRLYAVRDVTATVESIPLITASILSKKLAAGLEALVLDVKCGSGAFMKTPERAEALARALVSTAQGAGCMTSALITDMSQPLATAAGNALEVIEVMETLTGTSVNTALWDLTAALGGEALALAGLAADPKDGAGRIAQALESGAAAEIFGRMVAAQGGPSDFVERWPDRLPSAPVMIEVPALADGYVTAIDGEALGHAVVHLGGGRLREGDRVNPSVGLCDLAGIGEETGAGVPIAMVHAATEAAAEAAVRAVQAAYVIGPEMPKEPALVQKRIA